MHEAQAAPDAGGKPFAAAGARQFLPEQGHELQGVLPQVFYAGEIQHKPPAASGRDLWPVEPFQQGISQVERRRSAHLALQADMQASRLHPGQQDVAFLQIKIRHVPAPARGVDLQADPPRIQPGRGGLLQTVRPLGIQAEQGGQTAGQRARQRTRQNTRQNTRQAGVRAPGRCPRSGIGMAHAKAMP